MKFYKTLWVIAALVFGPLQSYAASSDADDGAGVAKLSPKDAFLARAQRSASCLVIYNGPQGPEVLLGQRNYDGLHYSNCGGLVDGEKSDLKAILPETEEETRDAYTPTADGVFQLHELSIFNNLLNSMGHRETHHTIFVHEVSEKKDPGALAASTHEQQEMTTYTWILLKDLLSLRSPEELKTKLGQSGDLLPEFLVLLKQPQVHSKLQAYLTAHSKQSVPGDLDLEAVERLALIERPRSGDVWHKSGARISQMYTAEQHAAEMAENLKAYYTKPSESIITFEHKSVNAWRTLDGFMGDVIRLDDSIVLNAHTEFTPGVGLRAIKSSVVDNPIVQAILGWSNRMQAVHAEIKLNNRAGRDQAAVAPEPTLEFPTTATEAMLEYTLGDEFVPGDDEGNIRRLIPRIGIEMGRQSPPELVASKREYLYHVFYNALQREKANPQFIALYNGTGGDAGFKWLVYKTLYNLMVPQNPRHTMLRPNDRKFAHMTGIQDVFDMGCGDNYHVMCTNMSAVHNVTSGGTNSWAYFLTSSPAEKELDKALKTTFGSLGLDLADEDLRTIQRIYEQYFLVKASDPDPQTYERGVLLQLLVDPEWFAHNARLTPMGFTPIDVTNIGGPKDYTGLAHIQDIRARNFERLRSLTENASSLFPLVAVDPAEWDSPTASSHTAYYPAFQDGQEGQLAEDLRQALLAILNRHTVKSPETLWNAFSRPHKAVTEMLKREGVRVQWPPLENGDVVKFFEHTSPEQVAEYLGDYPGFLDQEFTIAEKDLPHWVPLADPERTVTLSAREILMRLLVSPFSGERELPWKNGMQSLVSLAQAGALDLRDPRISFFALHVEKLRDLLIDRGIWGAHPIVIKGVWAEPTEEPYGGRKWERETEYRSVLHTGVSTSPHLENCGPYIEDWATHKLTKFGELLRTPEFKAYILEQPPAIKNVDNFFRDYGYSFEDYVRAGNVDDLEYFTETMAHLFYKRLGWSREDIGRLIQNADQTNVSASAIKHGLRGSGEAWARETLRDVKLNESSSPLGYKPLEGLYELIQMLPEADRALAWTNQLRYFPEYMNQDRLYDWNIQHYLADSALAAVIAHCQEFGFEIPTEVYDALRRVPQKVWDSFPDYRTEVKEKLLALMRA